MSSVTSDADRKRRRRRLTTSIKESLRELSIQPAQLNRQVGARAASDELATGGSCRPLLAAPAAPSPPILDLWCPTRGTASYMSRTQHQDRRRGAAGGRAEAARRGRRQRPCRLRTLSPNVQPFEPSQLIDQVIRPFTAPPTLFHDCDTSDGVRYPPPAPGCAGSPGTCLS